ncbi:MAG: hypothetical protein JWR51_1812 [Devosia sp.]|uniref:hypothetical protein n=1 Tax=Devosia sp. TaxID=1871048 RepID=UPI00262E96D7|nr:hypothetical protein [Devosia sp.]MDB5528709.1 hypothetical protein [Devosia sp.]
MKTLKIIVLTATLLAGATAAYASPHSDRGGINALSALSDAQYATVLKVNPGEARSLKIDTDTAALQALISQNHAISATIAAQGYAPSDIIGITGTGSNITLYAL